MTSMTDECTGVQKPTMNAFHTSQHVTGPQTSRRLLIGQPAPVRRGRGGETNQSAQHAFVVVTRGSPGSTAYLRRLQHCQRARHGGKRLVCLLDIHGELVGRGGGGGARLQGGGRMGWA